MINLPDDSSIEAFNALIIAEGDSPEGTLGIFGVQQNVFRSQILPVQPISVVGCPIPDCVLVAAAQVEMICRLDPDMIKGGGFRSVLPKPNLATAKGRILGSIDEIPVNAEPDDRSDAAPA